jgi:murein L,D-transpeptidase YcbB/YkuD
MVDNAQLAIFRQSIMPATSPPVSTPSTHRCRLWLSLAAGLAIGLASELAVGLTSEPASASSFPAAAAMPLWFVEQRPRVAAYQAVNLLGAAAQEGLEAGDYNAEWLRAAIESAGRGSPLTDDSLSRLDEALTSAMRRYLVDLHAGRVDPQELGARYSPAATWGFAPDDLLAAAIADGRLVEAVRGVAPALQQYTGLREALARYRELVGHPAWQKSLPPLPAGKLFARSEIRRHRGTRRAAATARRPARRHCVASSVRRSAGRRRQVFPGATRDQAGWRDREGYLRATRCTTRNPRAAA